jgi:hypothetical protein
MNDSVFTEKNNLARRGNDNVAFQLLPLALLET